MQQYVQIKGDDFLTFINQDEEDEAWGFSTTLVEKLRNKEPVSPPCFEETAGIMRQKFESILSESTTLHEDDKAGLRNFLSKLERLKTDGYPYYESVACARIFPELLYLCYQRISGHYDGLSIDQHHALFWDAFYQTQHDKKFTRDGYFGRGFIKDIKTIIDDNRIIWPVFSELTIDDMNHLHYLPVVPMGLTCDETMHHDGQHMTCDYFTHHDLNHERDDVHSALSQDPYENNKRKSRHQRIQGIYLNVNKQQSALELRGAIGLFLFELLHESKRGSIEDAGCITEDYHTSCIFEDLFWILYKLQSKDRYCDLLKTHQYLTQSWWLSKGALWLIAFNQVSQQVSLTNRIPFDDVSRKYKNFLQLAEHWEKNTDVESKKHLELDWLGKAWYIRCADNRPKQLYRDRCNKTGYSFISYINQGLASKDE